MAIIKPEFKTSKNGYNRFEVDDFVNDSINQNSTLANRCEIYQKEVARLNLEIANLTIQNEKLRADVSEKEFAYSKMNRIALKQANEIIQSASNDADTIVQEALSEAKIILRDIQNMTSETNELKAELKNKLTHLITELNQLEFVKVVDNQWLEDIK